MSTIDRNKTAPLNQLTDANKRKYIHPSSLYKQINLNIYQYKVKLKIHNSIIIIQFYLWKLLKNFEEQRTGRLSLLNFENDHTN